MVKNPPVNAGDARALGFNPWVRKIPWKGKWQPTPVFLPGESHGQRSLAGYSPLDCKESDMTKHAAEHIFYRYSLKYLEEWKDMKTQNTTRNWRVGQDRDEARLARSYYINCRSQIMGVWKLMKLFHFGTFLK